MFIALPEAKCPYKDIWRYHRSPVDMRHCGNTTGINRLLHQFDGHIASPHIQLSVYHISKNRASELLK
jgi:hypothetical protein